MDKKIRQLEKKDYPELASMFKEFATFQKMADKMVNTVELMEKESEFLNAYVVESENGELVGYATYFYAYYTWIGKSMYMDDLYVKPAFRGKGFGQKLINAIINKARNENCKKVHWQVSKWNKNAIEFYESIGAKVDDTESNCDYWLTKV